MGKVGLSGIVAAIVLSFYAAAGATDCAMGNSGDFSLWLVDRTGVEVTLAWQAVSGATGYTLQRSDITDFSAPAVEYTIASAVTAYGDTSASAMSYYRLVAQLSDGTRQYSNCVAAGALRPSEPRPRGIAGDLWADVVLGKPDFGQNTAGKTTASGTQWAGGVVLDRHHTPSRMYIADTNHNRVLGFDHIGRCAGLQSDVALGRPYTKSAMPSPSYDDSGGREFTDGQDAGPWPTTTTSFAYPHSSSAPLTVDVDIDLGVPTAFDAASLNSGAYTDRYTAQFLDLLGSDDKMNWTPIAQYDNSARDFTFTVTFPLITVRYVRFHITALTGCTDCDWLFLGEGRVGLADTVGDVCTVDNDCGGAQCVPDPDLQPQVVLGQPSFTDASACNGDGTGQLFPARAPASAESLCLIEPLQVSIGETIFSSSMEVDDRGALYVPDLFNHRVLKFDDPFATDSVADDVWGQADFAGNLCNRGGTNPTNNSFCFIGNWVPRAGVALDDQGNLWVADSMNARVLRFPNNGGAIAHDADVVLGQPSFTARNYGDSTRGLDEMLFPLDVAFDPSTHKLYVADAGFFPSDSRVLEFSPPFAAAGTPATRTLPLSLYCDFDFPNTRPAELTLDTVTHQLWIENSCFFTELFSLDSTPTASLRVKMPQSDGIDVDAQGNLFTIGKWSDLYRYPRSQIGLDYQANDLLKQKVFPGSSPHTADTISGPGGVTVFGNQLIVADADRLMIWNDYDPAALEHHGQPLRNGEPADDVYGEPDLNSDGNLFRWLQYFAYPQVENGQLWVERVTRGINDVLVLSAPLQHTPASGPLAIALTARARGTCTSGTCSLSGTPCTTEIECSFNGYPLLGSSTLISTGSADAIDFTVAPSGDIMWVADRWYSRVFRIADLWGRPYVDVILGQAGASGTACNRNGAAAPDTLCYPYDVALDGAGNLYVGDNGGEAGSNRRLLEFDASLFVFPPGQTTAKFGLPATRIFSASAQFEISPFKAAFHPNGYMVIGNNAYSGTRFPMAYLNPLGVQTPQLQLGDMSSYPAGSSYFDQYGNLYFTDSDWSRVLIYKEPFRSLMGPVTPGPTSTPGPTVPPPTLVATCVGDCNGDGRVDIDELLIMVNIALGSAPPETCLAGDANGDGRVRVDEILTAVNASLNGCRSATGD